MNQEGRAEDIDYNVAVLVHRSPQILPLPLFRNSSSRCGMSRALLKLSGSLVHDYATISDDSPSPNRASRARRAATSAGIS